MAHSTFIERSPESDKTLILVMDEDFNLTGHPKHIDKMLALRQTQELRVVRLRASAADSDTDSADEEGVPKINLTVEEICPEDAGEEGRSGDSTLPSDFVDPLSQLDDEQMLRLKKALASEQAKQILGENVTAMLDMLSVEENATAILQQSIRFDHCYTNLTPSADPKGPAFVHSTGSASATASTSAPSAAPAPKPRGRPPGSVKAGASLLRKVQPGSSSASSSQKNGESDSDGNQILDVDDEEYSQSSEDSDSDGDRDSDEDYRDKNTPRKPRGGSRGSRRGWGSLRMRGGISSKRRGRPKVVTSDTEDSKDVSVQDESPPAVVKIPGKRGRPRKVFRSFSPSTPATVKLPVASPTVDSPTKPPGSTNSPVVDQTPADTAAAKVISGDAIRLGRPSGKTEEERRREMARVIQSLEAGGRKVIVLQRKPNPAKLLAVNPNPAKPSDVNPSPGKLSEVKPSPAKLSEVKPNPKQPESTASQKDNIKNVLEGLEMSPGRIVDEIPILNKSPTKPKTYERRDSLTKELENADTSKMMGNKYPRRENRKLPAHLADTALFSAPDVIKRLSAGEELTMSSKVKGKQTQRSMLSYFRKVPTTANESPTLEPLENPSVEPKTEVKDEVVILSEVSEEIPAVEPTSAIQAAVNELQNMLEEGLEAKKAEKISETVVKQEEISEKVVEVVKEVKKDSGHRRRSSEKDGKTARKAVESRRRSSVKTEEKVEDRVKTDRNDGLDVMQLDASILQTLPQENMNQLIKSVVEDDDKEEVKKEKVGEEIKKDKRSNRSSKDGKSNPGNPKPSSSQHVVSSPTENADEKKRNAAKRRRSDEVSDLEEDEDDTMSEASWNSEDDPERLWCICRKPHDNRFMICCDVCQDWFHGQCVGISKSLGKQMEADGLEWSCPKCTKKKKEEEREKDANKQPSNKIGPSNKGPELKQTKLSNFPVKLPPPEETTARKCIMCKGPVRENSIYCSDDCIRKHSQRAISQLSSKVQDAPPPAPKQGVSTPPAPVKREERRIIVMDPTSKKILTGQSAPTAANLAAWLQKNPSYHVLYQRKPPPAGAPTTKIVKVVQGNTVKKVAITPKVSTDAKSGQLKLTVSPNSKQIKIVTEPNAQSGIKLIPAVPQKKVIYVNKGGTIVRTQVDPPGTKPEQKPESKDSEPDKKLDLKISRKRKEKHQVLKEFKQTTLTTPVKVERRESGGDSSVRDSSRKSKPAQKVSKMEDKGGGGGSELAIRESVKKTLGEALKARAQDCKDLEVDEDDIETLVHKIEERLYRHFDEKVDVKYKSKYRSLVFNIKDQKNETLFRKILEKSISPRDLVKLTAEELASQELAQWREKEQQHQLEMIKKTELELMTQGQTFIIKSHKGEDVIAKDHKVAAVVAEIDPNTPAQELVSALNSVSSTTPDNVEDEEKDKHRSGETSLMKMKKREKEKRREKERKRKSKDKDRKRGRSRSRSRDRSSRRSSKSSKKRSRSRSRHRHRSRDRKEKSRDGGVEEKAADSGGGTGGGGSTPELAEISTTDSLPHVPEIRSPGDVGNDDADYEPTSTVTIKTPEIYTDEVEDDHMDLDSDDSVWAGQIVMAEVAKFPGRALHASGDSSNLKADIKDKLSVVGRISYDTVWEYMARMKKMATKDIIVIQILPSSDNEEDHSSFTTLWSYLFKRSRIGVIGKTSDAIKDFYLYPHKASSHPPEVLEPLTIPLIDATEQILLGIIVRSKRSGHSRKSASSAVAPAAAVPPVPPPSLIRPKPAVPVPETPLPLPEPSTSPPLVSSSPPDSKKDPRLKKKVKVQVAVTPVAPEDDDSPYSPASSDEDLPPLSKVPRKVAPSIPTIPTVDSVNLTEAAQIQKEIEKMNRAIEEQTQQIQSLVSTAPLLPVLKEILPVADTQPAPSFTDLTAALPALKVLSAIVQPVLPLQNKIDTEDSQPHVTSTTVAVERSVTPVPGEMELDLPTPMEVDEIKLPVPTPMELDIPIPPDPEQTVDKKSADEPYSPTAPLSPAAPTSAISMPGVAGIALPSNLQEILAAINKKEPVVSPASPEPLPPGVEEEKASQEPEKVKETPATKLGAKGVFENEGVPSFEPGTSKGKPVFKFDMKIKTKDLEEPGKVMDIDERQQLPVDRDERVVEPAKDRDERLLPVDRDDRISHRDRGRGSNRDRDDRELNRDRSDRYSTRDRDDRRYRDKDDRYRRRRDGRHRDPVEDEWEGSIRQFEEAARRKNRSNRDRED